MTSQVGFKKKSRYLENETFFLPQIKKIIKYLLRATLW